MLLRLLALPLAATFVASLLGLILLLGVQHNLLRANTYKRALEQQSFYARVSRAYAEQLASTFVRDRRLQSSAQASPEEQELATLLASPVFHYLSAADWEAILNEVAPPGWIRSQTEQAIDGLLGILNGYRGEQEVIVSLAEPKSRLSGQGAKHVAERIVGSWPECGARELASLAASPAANLEKLPICRPPAPYDAVVVQALEAEARFVGTQMPDQVVLSRLVGGSSVVESTTSGDASRSPLVEGLRELQGSGRRLVAVTNWGWLVPLGLLLLVAALAVRSWRDLALWWGFPILIAGGSCLTLALSLPEAIRLALQSTSIGTAPLLRQLAIDVAVQVTTAFADWLLRAGATTAGVGFVAIVLSLFLRDKSAKAGAGVADASFPTALSRNR